MKKDISSVNDDFNFQHFEWPVKRISWIIIGLFLVYGILGGLGDNTGPIYNYTADFRMHIFNIPDFSGLTRIFS